MLRNNRLDFKPTSFVAPLLGTFNTSSITLVTTIITTILLAIDGTKEGKEREEVEEKLKK